MKRAGNRNSSRAVHRPAGAKLQFRSWPLLIVGSIGMLAGLAFEILDERSGQIYMQLGGIAGLLVGGILEGVWYHLQKLKARSATKGNPN